MAYWMLSRLTYTNYMGKSVTDLPDSLRSYTLNLRYVASLRQSEPLQLLNANQPVSRVWRGLVRVMPFKTVKVNKSKHTLS